MFTFLVPQVKDRSFEEISGKQDDEVEAPKHNNNNCHCNGKKVPCRDRRMHYRVVKVVLY